MRMRLLYISYQNVVPWEAWNLHGAHVSDSSLDGVCLLSACTACLGHIPIQILTTGVIPYHSTEFLESNP